MTKHRDMESTFHYELPDDWEFDLPGGADWTYEYHNDRTQKPKWAGGDAEGYPEVTKFDHEDKATFSEHVEADRYKERISDLYRYCEPRFCKHTLAISLLNLAQSLMHDLSREKREEEYKRTGKDTRGGSGKKFSGSY